MLPVLAGFLIAMGGVIYLKLGGIAGALFFALGLTTILTFGFELFTGKCGLIAKRKITFIQLLTIWVGNFVGAAFCALLVSMLPMGPDLMEEAAAIQAVRNSQLVGENFILGMYCGMLMSIAVFGFQKTKNYLFAIVPVAFFILCGFNHCVADMFYGVLGDGPMWHLIPTTLGNMLGANIISRYVE